MTEHGEKGRLIILSAPSGAGKSTIVKALMEAGLGLRFSVSATTRAPRPHEEHGREYYFLTLEEFHQSIEKQEFIEYEEVYKGCFYGTLKSEVEKILAAGSHVVFDIDVVGGLNIKKLYGDQALAIFIRTPGIGVLRQRLQQRGTETEETLGKRIEKARWELSFAPRFDVVIMNDQLPRAIAGAIAVVRQFINA